MERLIWRWKESGRSCTAFAEANGVSVSKFFYWKRRLESEGAGKRRAKVRGAGSSRFLPVRLLGNAGPVAERGGLVELVLETGERVRLTEEVSEETLRRVIRVLTERE
jgi:hypothetical protein